MSPLDQPQVPASQAARERANRADPAPLDESDSNRGGWGARKPAEGGDLLARNGSHRPPRRDPILRTSRDRPKRADALRNYAKVIAAARQAFAESGASTSLEEIARRAGVGIGTLYRHFPSRQALLEAVYEDEVEDVCRQAAELDECDPWEALVSWLHRFVGYLATKRALAEEMLEYMDRDAQLFQSCRESLFAAAQPLLERAQRAGAARSDVTLPDVIKLVGAVAKIPAAEPGQTERILEIALDGLRARPPER
jgi:AcrR family transcriptional regulator